MRHTHRRDSVIRLCGIALLLLTLGGSFACQTYTDTLVESPRRVDERVAVSTLRSIGQAQTAFSLTNSGDYATFEQLVTGGHLDARFNSSKPRIYGYFLTMTVSNRSSGASESSYGCNADPDPAVNPAGRHFYLSSDSPELRVNPSAPASANDPSSHPSR